MKPTKKPLFPGMRIRNLDRIRAIYSHIYIYGMFTREDFISSGIASSPESYDKIIKQLRDLYLSGSGENGGVIESDIFDSGKKKRYKFRRDYFRAPVEELSAVYGLYAASELTVCDVIRCLRAVNNSESGVTVSEVSLSCPVEDLSAPSPESRIRRKLDRLCEYGYIKKRGKYYVADDRLDRLSDNELIILWYFASFCAGTGYPRVPAYYLRETLRRKLSLRGLPEPREAFLFRDSPSANIFDEQTVFTLMECCVKKSIVKADIKGVGREFLPIRLSVDTKYGRWYLTAASGGWSMLIRVSNITNITAVRQVDDKEYENAAKTAGEKLKYCLFSNPRTNSPVVVEAELRFKKDYMREQFEREMLTGEIIKSGGTELYRAVVSDPKELKPLLRAYAGQIKILPGEGHSLDREIISEYKEMLENYGVVQ